MVGFPRKESDRGRFRSDRPEDLRPGGKLGGLFRLLDEHGDAIEADLTQFYNGYDLSDFYRGDLSLSAVRRLGVLVRELPHQARLVTALNGGQPAFGPIEGLLADLWVVLVRANAKKGALTDSFDHPARAALAARRALSRVQELKDRYDRRKQARTRGRR